MVNKILEERQPDERMPGTQETMAIPGMAENGGTKRIKIYIASATMNALEKNAKRCGCSKMFISRLAWSCGHETFRSIIKENDHIPQVTLEKIKTKKGVPLYVDIQSEIKKELTKDADTLGVPLSQYLRLLLDLYLKNLKVKE